MLTRTRSSLALIFLFSIFISSTNAGTCCLYRSCTTGTDVSCASQLGRYYSSVEDCADTDNDGWADVCDNCPNLYNPDQLPDADCDGFIDASTNICDNSCAGYLESPKNDFIKTTFEVPSCTTKQTLFTFSLLGEQKTAVNDFLGQNIATKTGFPSYIQVKRVGVDAGHKFSYYTGIGGGIDQTGFPGTVTPADGGGCTILYDDHTGFVDYSDMQLSPSVYKGSTSLLVAAGGGGLGAAFPTSNVAAAAAGSMLGISGECGIDGDLIACSNPTGGNSLTQTAGVAGVSINPGYTYQGQDGSFLRGGNVMKADIYNNVLGFTGAGGCGYYGGGGASSHTTGKFHAGAGGSSYVGKDYWTSLVQTALATESLNQNVLLKIHWNTTCQPVDNCLNAYNPDQLDTNGDGMGDVCDPCPLLPSAYGPDHICSQVIAPPPPPITDTCCLRIGDDACSIYGGSFTSPNYCYLSLLSPAICLDAGGSASSHEDCSCTQGDDPDEYMCNGIDDDCDGFIDEGYDFTTFNCSLSVHDDDNNVDLPCTFLLVETCDMKYHLNRTLLITDLCMDHLQANEMRQQECGVAHIFTRPVTKDEEKKWDLGFMEAEPKSVGIGVALFVIFIIVLILIIVTVCCICKKNKDEVKDEENLSIEETASKENDLEGDLDISSDDVSDADLSDAVSAMLSDDYGTDSGSGVYMETLGPGTNPDWQLGILTTIVEDNNGPPRPALFSPEQLRAQAAAASSSRRSNDSVGTSERRMSSTYIPPPGSLSSFTGNIIDPNAVSVFDADEDAI